jgi:hypothetical protein
VLREFIGTKDGSRVYCYDLVDRREHHNRDRTHLWHIHLSVTRKFVGDWPALAGVLSVLTGEAAADPLAIRAPADPLAIRAPTAPGDRSWRKEIVSKMEVIDLSRVTSRSGTWIRGAAVRRLQGLLLADGHGPGGLVGAHRRPDGVAGPATKAALGAAQRKHRTGRSSAPATPDFVAGRGTLAALLGVRL